MAGRRAVLTFDLIAAAGLTLILVTGFTLAARQFVHARDYTDAQRLLRLAAEAELNRLRAGFDADDRPGDTQPVEATPDPVILDTTHAPGTGVWSGFMRVTVVARKQIRGGRWVRVELASYLLATEGRP